LKIACRMAGQFPILNVQSSILFVVLRVASWEIIVLKSIVPRGLAALLLAGLILSVLESCLLEQQPDDNYGT